MSTKIEQLIDEIEDYIENCKYVPLSNNMIKVNKDEIEELLRDLRMKTPDEIKRYQKIISQKEAILNDAREKAEALLQQTAVQTNELINEHEIMQQAYAQANEIVTMASEQAQEIKNNAIIEANSYRAAAIEYMDKKLQNLESIIEHTMGVTSSHVQETLASLQNCLDVVRADQMELHPEDVEAEPEQPAEDNINLDMI